MDGVPVKISERCRPPNKVHLPATLRTLPPPEPTVQPITFELETNALHWVQERRRNLLSEKTERRSRLEIRDEAKRKRKEELAEQARKEEEERQKREEEMRRRQEEETAQRLAEEEEHLRREEERRLEEFRLRHQLQQEVQPAAGTDSAQSPAHPAPAPAAGLDPAAPSESAAAAVATAAQAPDESAAAVAVSVSATPSSTATVASSVTPSQSTATTSAAVPPPTASSAAVPSVSAAAAAPHGATQSVPAWPAGGAISSNPYNPFVRPGSAVMQPQCWQQQPRVPAAAEPRSGSFNYRDFESQASDPFDSAELKTINDMEELASVFRPPPASAASAAPAAAAAAQPQPAYRYQQQQQQQQQQHQHPQQSQQSQQPQQHYYSHAGGSATGQGQTSGGAGYGFPRAYAPYPPQSYAQTAYSAVPAKTFASEQPTYRYPSPGFVYTSAGGREPFAATRPSSFPTASSAAAGGSSAPAATVAPSQPDARQLQEFYTRYYATPGRVSPGLPGLRSSRSVPDLNEEVQREMDGGGAPAADGGAARRTKSHTPPPQPPPATNGPSSSAQVFTPRPEPSTSVTDPLHGLDTAVKTRLQELGQMGFPLDRIRRLHNQFGGDEKQVIEFCLSAQRLEEAGHSPLAAERGLMECDGDLGRAADFLSSLAQLTGLGFPEPRAADALRRSDMHRDRALDLLIQG